MATSSEPVVEELAESQCWALLRKMPIGRIALHHDDEIEIFPVNFVVDSATVVFRTARGTKLDLIGDRAPCTFEVDEIDVAECLVWSVMLKGSAQPVRGHDAIIATFDMAVPTWQVGHKPTYVRVSPSSITGRRFPALRT